MKQEHTPSGQYQKFINEAFDNGRDKSEAAFNAKLRQIAKVIPEPEGQPTDRKDASKRNEPCGLGKAHRGFRFGVCSV